MKKIFGLCVIVLAISVFDVCAMDIGEPESSVPHDFVDYLEGERREQALEHQYQQRREASIRARQQKREDKRRKREGWPMKDLASEQAGSQRY